MALDRRAVRPHGNHWLAAIVSRRQKETRGSGIVNCIAPSWLRCNNYFAVHKKGRARSRPARGHWQFLKPEEWLGGLVAALPGHLLGGLAQFLGLLAERGHLAFGVLGVQRHHLLRILGPHQLLGELEGRGDIPLGEAHGELAGLADARLGLFGLIFRRRHRVLRGAWAAWVLQSPVSTERRSPQDL